MIAAVFSIIAMMASPKITIEPPAGATLSGRAVIRVASSGLIESATFRLGARTPFIDESTPFTYHWDTLESDDGMQTIDISIRMADGSTINRSVEYRVDNQISRGHAYWMEQAMRAYEEGEYAAARDAARRARKAAPDDVNTPVLLAAIQLTLSRPEESVPTPQLTGADERVVTAYRNAQIAVAFRDETPSDTLISTLRELLSAQLATRKNRATALHDASPEIRADAFLSAGQYEDAADAFNAAARGASDNWKAYLNAATAFLLAGKTVDARRQVTMALPVRPDAPEVRLFDLLTRSVTGQSVVVTPPSSTTSVSEVSLLRLVMADAAMRAGRYAEAVQALVAAPPGLQRYAVLVLAHALTRAEAESRDALREAILLDPCYFPAYINRALGLLFLDRPSEARSFIELAALIRPEDPLVLACRALVEQNVDTAVQLASSAVKASQSAPWALMVQAWAYERIPTAEAGDAAAAAVRQAYERDRARYDFSHPQPTKQTVQLLIRDGIRGLAPLPFPAPPK